MPEEDRETVGCQILPDWQVSDENHLVEEKNKLKYCWAFVADETVFASPKYHTTSLSNKTFPESIKVTIFSLFRDLLPMFMQSLRYECL
jgi:hypothetical protein